MDAKFWQERWATNQIGFHQVEVNPYLQQYWSTLAVAGGSKVFVPLCGKSLDMMWLAGRGHRVMGVEVSQLAVEAFFREQALTPQAEQRGAFKVYQAGLIEVWCGDFFTLDAQVLADCTALYDRAALIALQQPMRAQYTAHLDTLLTPGCKGLLIAVDYDQAQRAGPPFAVADEEVQSLLGAQWNVVTLQELDILSQSRKFMADGVTRLEERVYRLTKR